ncbi:MAG: MBL fold metallo-hydrolase [Firmicutes bacterium]|nr:MBL fold metallo-hydrolase [Bacillota bacterium]
MDLKLFYTGPMQVNTYLCVDESSKKGFIVDPGGASKPLENYIDSNEYNIEYIILTHGHGDHVCGVLHYKELYDAPIVGHKDDNFLFNDANENLSLQFVGKRIEFTPDIYVDEGDTLKVGNMELKIFHTPGHTPGGISILVDNILFSGDTLFADSIGRTDFKGGSFSVLKQAVHSKLFVLPDDTFVLPGHMGTTTIGHEKQYNPFL